MKPIHLADKFTELDALGTPKIISRFNGQDVMLVKFEGEFPWESRADCEGFFLVLSGEVLMETRIGMITLTKDELYVIPKGLNHRIRAKAAAQVLLIEASSPSAGVGDDAAPGCEEI